MDPVLLIYDGGCRGCRWGITLTARLDRRNLIVFCPFGHPRAEAELAQLPPDERYESMHAVVRGQLFSATDAARVVMRVLPLGRVTTALQLHRAYPLLARFRGVLGRFAPDIVARVDCEDRTRILDTVG